MKALESSDKISTERVSARPGLFTLALREHTNDPRWQLALRIAASLGRSRLMVNFLLYVVDRQIHDRSDEITEPQIGVLIFGRPEGYNTNEDNIVRSYARNLRRRIEEYFATEGGEEDLLLKSRAVDISQYSRGVRPKPKIFQLRRELSTISLHRLRMYSQI